MDDFLNGFYTDDGELININNIPLPGLCVVCQSNQCDDPEENFLCQMNRYDQRDEKEFKCGAYEKLNC